MTATSHCSGGTGSSSRVWGARESLARKSKVFASGEMSENGGVISRNAGAASIVAGISAIVPTRIPRDGASISGDGDTVGREACAALGNGGVIVDRNCVLEDSGENPEGYESRPPLGYAHLPLPRSGETRPRVGPSRLNCTAQPLSKSPKGTRAEQKTAYFWAYAA